MVAAGNVVGDRAMREWLGIGPPEVPALDWIVLSAVLLATTLAVLGV